MSNKSSSGGSTISLPQGGGALHGIGEKFSPDLQTGTGNFTVPLALPAGRNGFQPQLSLIYSTGNGNGPFGHGWNLTIPGVSRKTSKGVPVYDDSEDVFILSGSEDLVPVSTEPSGTTYYRPRTEGLFARIAHIRGAGGNYWEVRSKDGLVSTYGDPATSVDRPAVIADLEEQSKVFAWKLSRTTDPFGNRIDYIYERDSIQTDGPHHWDQLYLSEVRYVDFGDPANPRFLVTVKFFYEARPDPFSEYRAGFEIRTVRRCTRIEVSTHAGTDILAKTYELVYIDQRGFPTSLLPPNGASQLSQIRMVGHDGEKTEALPPLEFSYTLFEPLKRKFSAVGGSDMPAVSLAHPDFELVDLFGSGLPDILEMNGSVRYWRNIGEGRFSLPREMRDAPAGIQLGDPSVQMVDADGDGRTDLMVTSENLSGYFPMRFGGLWDRRSFQRYRQAPSFNLKDPEVKLVDLDGDGVTDAIRSGTRLECFFNDPHLGWNHARSVERKGLDVFPNVNFSDPRVKWADLSGDGLQDIVLVYDGNIEYWPNLGYGEWGKRVHMRNSPRFPYGYNPKRILLGDVDGDGLSDLVYVDDTKVTLWINQSGNGWSDPIVITGTPPITDMDAVRVTDMFGAGIGGVLWSADAAGLSRDRMFFLDFTGGLKPYLLNEMNNHIGAVTRVMYAPSTSFYLDDQKQLATRWKTPLPFPVQVVARVEVVDALSKGKLTTEYRYHHGYWDGAEREFRGFGRVDQRDTEIFEDFHAEGLHMDRPFEPVAGRSFSPPVETRTWFHQGPVGDEFGEWQETDFSSEFWAGDPQVLSRTPSMVGMLKSLPRRVKRDALRTLRGSILRTELYALDGTPRQDRPYTVTESLHGICEVVMENGYAKVLCAAESVRSSQIFFPHAMAQRTTQWDRGNDPMSQFSFTDDYDDYGQPRSQIGIAVPRGRNFRIAASPGSPYLTTQTVTTYAQPRDDADRYIVNRTARTTTHEIINDGSPNVFTLRDNIIGGSAKRHLIGQTRTFYDGTAFFGQPFGQIDNFGAAVRSETLVLTKEILHEAYKSGDSVLTPPEEPPSLTPENPLWTPEYPDEFRNTLFSLAGYTFHAGGPDASDAHGYFVTADRRLYDFQEDPASAARGLVKTQRDPFGHDTSVVYDGFDLLPVEVTDAAGLKTSAVYDYRILQPAAVTDANGNQSSFTFSPIGLLKSTSIIGKSGEGDQMRPSMRMEYDFLAFANNGLPVSVRAIRHIHHDTETDIPLPVRNETIESIEYTDGFGRLLQTRAQAEDVTFGGSILPFDQNDRAGARQDVVGQSNSDGTSPNVVVSGWQIYDNKGRSVEKFEPFFSTGWAHVPPTDAELGQKIQMYYDPRGHVVRMLNPDGSEQCVVYGVPGRIAAPDLSNPGVFEPTPWETYTYDSNDNAGRTHPFASVSFQYHWNTPSNIVVDGLCRTVEAVERNRTRLPNGTWSPIEEYYTRSTYDIQGNLLTVTDALTRPAFTHVYDLAKQPLRIESIDAGLRRTVLDALGNAIEQRDSKGALILHAYDSLNRPIRLWARDGIGQSLTLRERLEYGDGSDRNQLAADRYANRVSNRLGKLAAYYDEAGRLTFETYDFKGNVREKIRRVISDATILAVFDTPRPSGQVQAFRVDWQPPRGNPLEFLDGQEYRTSISYDALNRIQMMSYPQDVDGARQQLLPHYNHAGTLERVSLGDTLYVDRIAYNAKGQRLFIAYGNGVITRHAYDPTTFRLIRCRSELHTQPKALTYHLEGGALQEFAYTYDLAGNITIINDRTPSSGIPNTPLGTDALDRAFVYDPLYRLITANGRECDTASPDPPWDDRPKCQDVTLTRAYMATYTYDRVGNILRMGHSPSATRTFHLVSTPPSPVPASNRLATVTIGQTAFNYTYDSNGNVIQETTSRHFEWDHSDRMRVYRTQTENAEPSLHAHYLYDASGLRVKKLIRKGGGQYQVTVYVDGMFEHHRIVQGKETQDNNDLHVMDNHNRIALIRVGTPFSGDTTPAVKYNLGDHLGNSNVVIDASSALINREEYTPYGESSFGTLARKRYRFIGKERDEESGLHYHGARYYASALGRWISADPLGRVDGINLFAYVRNSPLGRTDRNGRKSGDISDAGVPPADLTPTTPPDAIVESKRIVDAGAGQTDISGTKYSPENEGTHTEIGNTQGQVRIAEVTVEGHVPPKRPPPAAANLLQLRLGGATSAFGPGVFPNNMTGYVGHLTYDNRQYFQMVPFFGSAVNFGEGMATASQGDVAGATGNALAGAANMGGALAPALTPASELAAGAFGGVRPSQAALSDIGVSGPVNCFNRAFALERRLAGAPASAIGGEATTLEEAYSSLREIYPSGTSANFASRSPLERFALSAGEGTRGVVLGSRGGTLGHAFNVVVSNGRVIFLDAGIAGRANLAGYSEFDVFFTQLGGGF